MSILPLVSPSTSPGCSGEDVLLHIRQLRSIRRSLTIESSHALVSSGVFRISKRGGGKFSLATSAHAKKEWANQVFQFCFNVKKNFGQRGHGPMPPPPKGGTAQSPNKPLLVRALVLTRVDYCNGLLGGAPKCLLSPLSGVLRASARLILLLPRTR